MGIFAPDGKLARVLNCIGNLIILNILTLILCLPVITAGAAMTALYTMTMRMARNEEGNIVREYFRAFKGNFTQATLLWAVFGFIQLFLAFDIYILRTVTGTFGLVYRILLFVLLLLFAMECIHIFAVQARFENTPKNTAKNALLFMAGHFPQAVLMLCVTLSPLLLLSASFRFISVVFLIGLSGPAYLAGIYFKSIFKAYEKENTHAQIERA